MLKLLKTIHNAGDVTLTYPFTPIKVCPGFRGKPQYDPTQCIACGACTVACPTNALTLETDLQSNQRVWQLFVGRCIFCGRCEEVCPTRAIVLSEDFELAVLQREDLYQRATFELQHCRDCGDAFAPKKSVEYAMTLLTQSGIDAQAIEQTRVHFETCPECKRKQLLSRMAHYELQVEEGPEE